MHALAQLAAKVAFDQIFDIALVRIRDDEIDAGHVRELLGVDLGRAARDDSATPADVANLPSGTRFVVPDGSGHIKVAPQWPTLGQHFKMHRPLPSPPLPGAQPRRLPTPGPNMQRRRPRPLRPRRPAWNSTLPSPRRPTPRRPARPLSRQASSLVPASSVRSSKDCRTGGAGKARGAACP